MKSCLPYGKYILAVFFIRKIPEILVFFMVNSMCSLCRIRYGNFFVFVVDGVQRVLCTVKAVKAVRIPCYLEHAFYWNKILFLFIIASVIYRF